MPISGSFENTSLNGNYRQRGHILKDTLDHTFYRLKVYVGGIEQKRVHTEANIGVQEKWCFDSPLTMYHLRSIVVDDYTV